MYFTKVGDFYKKKIYFNAAVVVEDKRTCIIDGHGTIMLAANYQFQKEEVVKGVSMHLGLGEFKEQTD